MRFRKFTKKQKQRHDDTQNFRKFVCITWEAQFL